MPGMSVAADGLRLWSRAASSEVKMLRVPSVTMNGGSLTRVTSAPLRKPGSAPTTATPTSSASGPGTPCVGGELGHDDVREQHDGADRQVDAGGEDDERLADGQRRRRRRSAAG